MNTAGLEFSNIYERYHEKIRRYVERMVGVNDAEDVTQEVFMKINKGLKDFEGKSGLSTWVYRIATNSALDKIRRRPSCQEKMSIDAVSDRTGQEPVDIEATSLSAEREAIRNEMNECILEFVDRLPIDYRTIIILSEMKDLKNQEIADILGVSLDAAKIRLHRARIRLKAEFEAGCDFYHDEDGKLACDRKNKPKEPK
ncbi:MAG: RNA polymerase sigma factor [Planctomycetota bacterium]|jgi:RNA polymerase sigma-70 factor (ECF subfamily)